MSASVDDAASASARVARLLDLAGLPALPLGATVWIEERAELVYSLGNTTPAIAARLGWTQPNVWLREIDRARIARNHREFVDAVATIATVLTRPMAVHADRKQRDAFYFIIDAAVLRGQGLLTSQSIRLVDLVIQSHEVEGVRLNRAFHLGGTRRSRGGAQLWP